MKIWGELTFKQIGDTLGISPNTAAARYRYRQCDLRLTMTRTHATTRSAPEHSRAPQASIYRPVTVRTSMISQQDEGIVQTPGERTLQRVSYQLVDEIEWQRLDGKQSITVTRPRQEVALVELAPL